LAEFQENKTKTEAIYANLCVRLDPMSMAFCFSVI